MDSKFRNAKESLHDCEKTSITTPFSINDILTKENEAKCDFDSAYGKGPTGFGGIMGFTDKSTAVHEYLPKRDADKGSKCYEEFNGFRDYAEDGVLDMSRKNSYGVTELSVTFRDLRHMSLPGGERPRTRYVTACSHGLALTPEADLAT
ncbi:hypothetical protein EVAR_36244_1 [Eumeta japonica]|uniref:Uncharacterized protein n=1 Tax=Eumeta variegata TaxID=151549 RepID=A0A4C1WW05_EUMVA|nr:hypothetical protein EVAR_36244_1 [Eumeta japonica]